MSFDPEAGLIQRKLVEFGQIISRDRFDGSGALP